MKKTLLILGLIFCSTSGFSNAHLASGEADKDLTNVSSSVGDVKIIEDEFSCTISFKVYIPTTSGIYGVGMSITADTCEQARQGMQEAVEGFISEI